MTPSLDLVPRNSGGGTSLTTTSTSSDYIASTGEYVLADASGGPLTVTLPAPEADATVAVKKTDASENDVTVSTPSGNIDAQASEQLIQQGESLTLLSDGTDWYIK
jgi:hypothetical protein